MARAQLALVLALFSAAANSATIPSLLIRADSPYNLGYQIGSKTKEGVQLWVKRDSPVLEAWANANSILFDAMRLANAARFPRVAEEISGVADAADVNETLLYALAMRPEIDALRTTDAAIPEGCSDVITRRSGAAVLAHNEDWDVDYKNYSYVIEAKLDYLDGRSIWSLAYPAYPYGFTFGWSSTGVAVSCNALGPAGIVAKQGLLARYFINRDALDSNGCDDAAARLRSVETAGAAYGFAASVACLWTKKMLHFEIAGTSYSEVEVDEGEWLWHVNRYNRLAIPQTIGDSTAHRAARFEQLSAPSSVIEVRAMLGDSADREYPIYRVGIAPDTGVTCATVVFDLKGGVAMLFNENPASSSAVAVIVLPRDPEPQKKSTSTWESVTWAMTGVCGALAICAIALAVYAIVVRKRQAGYQPLPVNSS